MTQHTTNTPKVPISDIVSPNMSPQADAAVQGAMERAAEKQAIKGLASRWHEMRNTAETKAQFERELDEYIDANYLPKAKVVEANAWLEEAIKPHDGNDMVADLIQEYKRKLGLESE